MRVGCEVIGFELANSRGGGFQPLVQDGAELMLCSGSSREYDKTALRHLGPRHTAARHYARVR